MMRFVLILIIATVTIFGQAKYISNSKSPYSTWKTDSLFVGADLVVVDSNVNVNVKIIECQKSSFGKVYWYCDGLGKEPSLLFDKNEDCEKHAIIEKLKKDLVLRFIYVVDSTFKRSKVVNGNKLYSGSKSTAFYNESLEPYKYGLVALGKVADGIIELGFDDGTGVYSELRLIITNVRVVK